LWGALFIQCSLNAEILHVILGANPRTNICYPVVYLAIESYTLRFFPWPWREIGILYANFRQRHVFLADLEYGL
jgi:hypothetical protein